MNTTPRRERKWRISGVNGFPNDSFEGAAILGGLEAVRTMASKNRSTGPTLFPKTLGHLIRSSPEPNRTKAAIDGGVKGVAMIYQAECGWPFELAELAAEGVVADELAHAPLFEILLNVRAKTVPIAPGIWCLSQGLHKGLTDYRSWLHDKPANGLAHELRTFQRWVGRGRPKRGRTADQSLRFLSAIGSARQELLGVTHAPSLRQVVDLAVSRVSTTDRSKVFRDALVFDLAEAHASLGRLSAYDIRTSNNRPSGSTVDFIFEVQDLYRGCHLVPSGSADYLRSLQTKRNLPPTI